MASVIEIPDNLIVEALGKVIDMLIDKYDALGQRASGQWARELEAETIAGRGIIRGLAYTEQLVQGRAPGKRPPIDPIQQWVQTKLNIGGDRSRGVAFAIATKIANEGTTWYQRGGSDLLEALESDEVINMFNTIIGDHVRIQITDILIRDFKTLEV